MRARSVLGSCAIVAAVATAGSLWFSEGLGLVPCELCWYQRILMYPLVVILGVGTLEDRVGTWRTALPVAVLGIGVSASHVWLQLAPSATCGLDGACTAVQWRGLGVFTIPRLSLLAFLLVTIGLGALALADRGIVDPARIGVDR
ncbi:disulfide bond formation protein B [Halopenitus sp. POP-27]|uniref:disulfide bond formation protein B n=1 Tax=Halopenitus sp. POP-27 TaxID=2994425 RepID=UPI002468433C|nr:disulfide bond formation protein B [Halopenitus sp. POP-27]